jgi:hypothetical protein
MTQRQIVTAYKGFAFLYDAVLGNHFLSSLRYNFEQLVWRYGFRFNSAADVACGTGVCAKTEGKQHVHKEPRPQTTFWKLG